MAPDGLYGGQTAARADATASQSNGTSVCLSGVAPQPNPNGVPRCSRHSTCRFTHRHCNEAPGGPSPSQRAAIRMGLLIVRWCLQVVRRATPPSHEAECMPRTAKSGPVVWWSTAS